MTTILEAAEKCGIMPEDIEPSYIGVFESEEDFLVKYSYILDVPVEELASGLFTSWVSYDNHYFDNNW
jgi:hypothetical protein